MFGISVNDRMCQVGDLIMSNPAPAFGQSSQKKGGEWGKTVEPGRVRTAVVVRPGLAAVEITLET